MLLDKCLRDHPLHSTAFAVCIKENYFLWTIIFIQVPLDQVFFHELLLIAKTTR